MIDEDVDVTIPKGAKPTSLQTNLRRQCGHLRYSNAHFARTKARSALAGKNRLPDVMQALRTAYESVSTERARVGPSVDARLRAIWKAVPDPPFDFDIAFFESGVHAWGTENPGYFDNNVWWVEE